MSGQSLNTQASRIAPEPTPAVSEKPKKDKKHKGKKTKNFQPFFGDEGDPRDEMPVKPSTEQLPAEKSQRTNKSRQEPYSDADRRLLAHLFAEANKNGILNAAQQDAGTREKKDKAWNSVVRAFNSQSRRKTPSTRKQLTKLAAKMRSEVRTAADEKHAAALKKYRLSCAQTGGGSGSLRPPVFDPDEDLASEDSVTDCDGDRSNDRDTCKDSASETSEEDDPEGLGAVESMTNNRAPLMTRYDDITTPKPTKKPRRSQAGELPEDEVRMVMINGVPRVFNTLDEQDGEGEVENDNTSTETPPGTSRKGQNRAKESKSADSVTRKRNPPPMMKPEPSNSSFQREADATISYLDTRQKIEQRKDILECKAFESTVAANEAKKEAYEAMAAWYRTKLAKYNFPPLVNYSPTYPDPEQQD